MGGACLPGDFEEQSALVLGCNELLPYHPQAMVEIIAALIDHLPLIAIVDGEDQRRHLVTLLCDWSLPAHKLHFVSLPVKGMWVRDYGPSFVRRPDGGIVILDPEYLEADRRNDDAAPTELAALLRVPVEPVRLTVEGGNLLSNGRGLCITTTTLGQRNAHRGYGPAQVSELLARHYGFSEFLVLRPLISEPTGHVDMFATFVSHDTVVVGAYDPRIDPVNADLLDENAAALATLQVDGQPLKVVRIPMPSNRGGVWRTYTNIIYANGRLLMPSYAGVDVAVERRARQVFRDLLPDWQIIGIETGSIINQRGALRCVSLNIPWMMDAFEPVRNQLAAPMPAG
jgi:agmatine/peptidylarginine deiminase